MHFSEEDLKDALRRKDPGSGFTQRVMARISQQEQELAASTSNLKSPWWRWVLRSHPALAGALAGVVLIAGSGLGYLKYEQVQETKRIEAQKAEAAKQQMVEALKITNAKLHHVFRRVSMPSPEEPKIRRQSL